MLLYDDPFLPARAIRLDVDAVIVLDTHVLIWTVDADPRLGRAARTAIAVAAAEDGVGVSAITPWEIALLSEKGRLHLGRDVGVWIDAALRLPGVRLAPILPAIAIDSVRLPGAFPRPRRTG